MYILKVGLGYCAFELYGLQRLLSPICQSQFSWLEGLHTSASMGLPISTSIRRDIL
jgi:hypothetical protein